MTMKFVFHRYTLPFGDKKMLSLNFITKDIFCCSNFTLIILSPKLWKCMIYRPPIWECCYNVSYVVCTGVKFNKKYLHVYDTWLLDPLNELMSFVLMLRLTKHTFIKKKKKKLTQVGHMTSGPTERARA